MWFIVILFVADFKFEEMSGKISKSKRAGIIFPVARIHNNLRGYAPRVSADAAIFLAAVIEITTRHIMIAIKTDSELDQLFGRAVIPNAGVVPQIHQFLIPKKKNAVINIPKEDFGGPSQEY
ncbi:unnamed protein product [Leptidea sinapis]|uniref:Histone H2A C-terminal domain-containing protein n=1 Tax=Leptidea sinapis TaxID=189913 RepID=A0A5E4PW47_9NEOP|nr:unnamed protein product [Leptidea sinapis]